MLTNKNYCDYETCVALRELGYNAPQRLIPDYFGVFDEPQYDERIHLYDAQKWMREEKNIEVNASFDKQDDGWIAFIQRLDYPDLCGTDVFSTVYNTYESALSEGLRTTIQILQDEQKEND